VAVAFSAGNLRAVAEALRKKLGPDVRLIIAGDNDAIETGTGQKAAIEAARAVGGLVAIPESPKTDWNDIAKAEGSKAVRKGIEAAVSLTAELGTSPTDWPEPREIASSGPAHQFPVDDLPPLLREAVCEAQSVIQCPVPMVAASAIAALSTAAQGLADVQRDAQLCGPVSLYLLVIAESGERKSTADGWFFGALRDWQRGRVTEMVPEVRRHHADFEAWMAEKDGVKQAIKALRKAGKPTDAKRDNLRSLEDCKPIGPLVPTLEIEDATPESIAHRLRFDWPSAALISAEAGAVLGGHAMGSDSLQRTLALLNKLWSGEALRIDRRTKESFVLDGARLTCGLAIQREGLDAFLSATGALARGSGFLARFLLCEPKSTQGTRLYRSPPAETPARARYVRALTDLLDLRLPMATGRLSPPALGLAPTAKGVWIDFYDEVERSLTGDLREARDTAAKAADNVVRLAALFHILENGPEGEITEASCRMATAVVTWFLFEARRFFRETTPALTVTKLEQWLRTQPPEGVPIRTVQQFGPYAARRPDSFKAAVAILTDAGRARIEGEHPPKLVLNPALRG
jgi:putative DNA primase/helicase